MVSPVRAALVLFYSPSGYDGDSRGFGEVADVARFVGIPSSSVMALPCSAKDLQHSCLSIDDLGPCGPFPLFKKRFFLEYLDILKHIFPLV
jgi:hypothetical protein